MAANCPTPYKVELKLSDTIRQSRVGPPSSLNSQVTGHVESEQTHVIDLMMTSVSLNYDHQNLIPHLVDYVSLQLVIRSPKSN